MDLYFDKNEELQNTINDIIEDVILLEAILLRMEHHSDTADFPREQLDAAFLRVTDYLSQHAFDLHTLTRSKV
jgi:hypothetical protein